MKKYKPFQCVESGITFKNFQQVREYIWNTRPHISELTGKHLLHESHPQWGWQFLHILNRNHTFWVLNPSNVLLGTVLEHTNQEQYPEFLERQEKMRQKYYQIYYNKQF